MPFALSFALLLVLLPVTCFAPGYLFVRRMRLSPLEKLTASVGLSLVLVYLFQLAVFVTGVSIHAAWLGTGAALLMLALSWRDLPLMLRRNARSGLIVTASLWAWMLLLLVMVRHYSGGIWAGDWVEHHERALYFLHRVPKDFLYLQQYWLPARPPLQNVVAAFFIAQFGVGYEVFQVVFAFLSTLVVLPCWLLARMLVRGSIPRPLIFISIFATSPMLAQNVTFTWTKLLAAGYVAMAVAFYLSGWRKNDSTRMVLAFTSLSAGVLVHYSAATYALFMAAHFGIMTLLRRRWAVREWIVNGVVNVALIATWIGYSIAVYGVHITLNASSTAEGYKGMSTPEKLHVIAMNVVNTIVPFSMRGVESPYAEQSSPWGWWRDFWFYHYQVNLPFMLGSLSWLAITWCMVRQWRRGEAGSSLERWFWPAFVIVNIVTSIAVHPPPIDRFGVAHVGSQPLVVIGLAYLAAVFLLLPRWARIIVGLSRLFDALVGIVLQFVLESLTLLIIMTPRGPRIVEDHGLSLRAANNWLGRTYLTFAGDFFAPAAMTLRVACGLLATGFAAVLIAVKPTRRRVKRPD